ncbi:unnamed protein product [Meganyctiphanes norvegica]|uniref:Reverse transcriptase domain-containing protein n=1 Tax=Meganyctiphanes norvegica TaxID=48144 RepID=A0AAV2PZU0_MEGNR
MLEPFMDPWAEQRFIREIKVPQPLFFSRMFSVPKKSGKRRPIIDLSLLNRRLKIPRFKMETIEVIIRTIHGELWGCSVDIVDAYLHLPLDWEFHKFFTFVMGEITFVFQVLPFGLSKALWAFSRVIKAFCHGNTIWLFSFLDDFLILARFPQLLREHTAFVIQVLQSLGFSINWENLVWSLSRRWNFWELCWIPGTTHFRFRRTKSQS